MLGIGLGALLKVGEFIVTGAVRIIGAVKGNGNEETKSKPPPHPKFKDVEHMRRQEQQSIAASKEYYAKKAAEKEKPK